LGTERNLTTTTTTTTTMMMMIIIIIIIGVIIGIVVAVNHLSTICTMQQTMEREKNISITT
jgi:uncharacterized membrane-anchored protein YhcB (DUF1043 family)